MEDCLGRRSVSCTWCHMAATHSSVALRSRLHGALDFGATASTDDMVEEVRQTEAEGGHRLRLEHRRSVTVVVPSMACVRQLQDQVQGADAARGGDAQQAME